MKHIFFKPWVGKNYTSGGIFGKRIMILGESHYCDKIIGGCNCYADKKAECPIKTTTAIQSYLNRAENGDEYEGWMTTYTKFINTLVGRTLNKDEKKEVWDSLLFYNFLQVAVESPRQAGAQTDYEEAVEPFFEVLEEYRPQYIVIWGERLWNHLPGGDCWEWADDVTIDGNIVKNGWYLLADGTKIKTFPIYHPSASFEREHWHKVMNTILNR